MIASQIADRRLIVPVSVAEFLQKKQQAVLQDSATDPWAEAGCHGRILIIRLGPFNPSIL